MLNKINNKIIVSSIGFFLIYKFYKHILNIEYINSLSKNEPFVIVDYSIETHEQHDIPEVNYINVGNYLHELGK